MSVWHWLVVALILGVLGLVIWKTARGSGTDQGDITPGFKGWLLLLAIGLWLLPLRLIGQYAKSTNDPDVAAASEAFPLLDTVDLTILCISLLLAASCLFLMHNRRRAFRTAFTVQYAWSVIAFPLSTALGLYLLETVYAVEAPGFGELLGESMEQWLAGILVGGLWVLYVYRSRRCAVTFTA